jgi:hypothetical protein
LANLASLQRDNSPEIESHYDIQPVIDIFASPDQRDLGSLAADIDQIVAKTRPALPRGTTIDGAARWTRCGPLSLVWVWE